MRRQQAKFACLVHTIHSRKQLILSAGEYSSTQKLLNDQFNLKKKNHLNYPLNGANNF